MFVKVHYVQPEIRKVLFPVQRKEIVQITVSIKFNSSLKAK